MSSHSVARFAVIGAGVIGDVPPSTLQNGHTANPVALPRHARLP
jgi:hypothetical protein